MRQRRGRAGRAPVGARKLAVECSEAGGWRGAPCDQDICAAIAADLGCAGGWLRSGAGPRHAGAATRDACRCDTPALEPRRHRGPGAELCDTPAPASSSVACGHAGTATRRRCDTPALRHAGPATRRQPRHDRAPATRRHRDTPASAPSWARRPASFSGPELTHTGRGVGACVGQGLFYRDHKHIVVTGCVYRTGFAHKSRLAIGPPGEVFM